jgi:hypothetical protein
VGSYPSPFQNVMQGAHNFVLRDSTFYVARNVRPMITALTTEILIRHFVKIEVHEHTSRGQDDTLFVPRRPNSSAIFTSRKDILKKLKDHFAPADQDNKHRKAFLLFGMGGIGKTQICLKFVEEVADR